MKDIFSTFIEGNARNIPNILGKYLRWIIFGVVSLFITGIALVILVIYLFIRLFTSQEPLDKPASSSQEPSLFQYKEQTSEERLRSVEDRLFELETRVNTLQ